MSGGLFLLIILFSIIFLVFMILKLKVHPVLALFTAALVTGLLVGHGFIGTVDHISNGFGGTLGGIGITIILGAIISMAIEDTGAAKSIANFFIKLFKGKRMELAPSLTAFIMSIPVFGDITMVLTAPIASMLSRRKHISMSTMASFTGLGLFLTHALVPPTPGILAIAIMFEADLGKTIVWGFVVALIAFFGTYVLIKKWTEKEWIEPKEEFVKDMVETESSDINDILIKADNLPGTFDSFMPLLLPVILISASSFAGMYLDNSSALFKFFTIIGNKVLALYVGLLYSIWMGYRKRKQILKIYKSSEEEKSLNKIILNKWVEKGLLVCLSPLLITAMGGAFGQVLKEAPAIASLTDLITKLPVPAIVIPWAASAILMTSVGSMTTAGMTAAGIVLPMLPNLGISPLAAVMAIGAGCLMGNHYSNSGFWVMGQFFNLNTKQSLKYVTIPCAVASIVALIAIIILNSVGVLG